MAKKKRSVKTNTSHKHRRSRTLLACILIFLVGFFAFLIYKNGQGKNTLAATTTTSEFGFNTHLNAAGRPGYWENLTLPVFKETVDDLVLNDQQWIRINIAPWEAASSGSPTKINWNESNLKKYDEAINYAKSKGLKVYLATALPDFAKDYSISNYIKASKLFHSTLAKRYKGKIDVWQVWNEADSHNFRDYSALPFGQENDAAYTKDFNNLLKETKNSIKGIDPKVKFTTNVGRYPANNDAMFTNMKKFLDKIQSNLDIISLDLYADGDYEGLSTRVNDVKNRYKKPVIIAETGLPSADGRFTEAQQGDFVSGIVNEFKLSDPMAIIIYQYYDTLPNTDTTEASFGIVRVDGSKKTSYDKIMSAMTPQIATQTGLLRFVTDPAVQATIRITSLETGQEVMVREWGISWESLPVGNYNVSLSYNLSPTINGNPVVIPENFIITIFKNQTTTVTASLTSGNVTTSPAAVVATSTSTPTPTNKTAPTLTPTPTTAQTTGKLTVTTTGANNPTINLYSYATNSFIQQSNQAVNNKVLNSGQYYVSFTYFKYGFFKTISKATSFTIQSGKLTEIQADLSSGKTTVTHK